MKNHALPAAEGGMQNAGPFKEGVMDDKLQTTPDKGLVTAEMLAEILMESTRDVSLDEVYALQRKNPGSDRLALLQVVAAERSAAKLNAALAPLIEREVAKAVWREHQIACPECRRIANGMPWTCERRAELKHLAGEQTT